VSDWSGRGGKMMAKGGGRWLKPWRKGAGADTLIKMCLLIKRTR